MEKKPKNQSLHLFLIPQIPLHRNYFNKALDSKDIHKCGRPVLQKEFVSDYEWVS